MKNYIISVIILGFWGPVLSLAQGQQIKGIAMYKTYSDHKIQLDNARINPENRAQLQEQLEKQLQKDFELVFDNISSSWKEVESIGEEPIMAAGAPKIMVRGGGVNSVLYKNNQEGKMEEGTEMMGKLFLIKESLPRYDWILTDETKQIGHYTCHRAYFDQVVDSRSFSSEMKEMEIVKDTITVEAWYTPEIPVSHGPENYWGLPGLIMELKTGNRIMVCSKIVLNPKNELVIERPKRGKNISRDEFKALQEEKVQDMMKKYRGNSGEGNIQIRIGN